MTPAPDDLTERVRQFVSDRTGARLDRVQLETRLRADLGVDGDDARELLDAFSREFDVDPSGLQFDEHFGSEGFPFEMGFLGLVVVVAVFGIWHWKWWVAASILLAVAFHLIQRRSAPDPDALRVRHLVRAVRTGRLDDGTVFSDAGPSEPAS